MRIAAFELRSQEYQQATLTPDNSASHTFANSGGLLDQRDDLLRYGAGTAPQQVIQNGHMLIYV
jgi:hypothetical protein